MSIPIGAAVRYQGRLGRVVRKSPAQRLRWLRGYLAVVLDGEDEICGLPVRSLQYVAKRYDTVIQWDAAQAATLPK